MKRSCPGKGVKSRLCIADPWVENSVEEVNDEVSDDVDDHQHGGKRHHGRRLTLDDRLVNGTAHTVDTEDALGDLTRLPSKK